MTGFNLQPCFAANNRPETTVSYITINNDTYYDVEIMIDSDGKIYLPFKQLAKLFEIQIKPNHISKEIAFETLDKKQGFIRLKSIEIDKQTISTKQNFYLKKGIMDETKDEIFVDENDLSKIFAAQIKSDRSNLCLTARTDRKLAIFGSEDTKEDSTSSEPKYKAYTQVVVPREKGKFSLDSISISDNARTDSNSQIFLNTQTSNFLFNNNTKMTMKGNALGGEYSAGFNSYNYSTKFFTFGGVELNYKNKLGKYNYELGSLSGFKTDKSLIGLRTFGVQVSDFDTKSQDWHNIEGQVAEGSLVNVYVDGKYNTTLNTYNGYYSLNQAYSINNPKTIRLEELKEDGTTKTILENQYLSKKNMLAKGEKRNSWLLGINGFNNQLWSQNGYIYQSNAKKLVMGYERQQGLRDNVKLDSKLIFDKIVDQPASSVWGRNFYNSSVVNLSTYKNYNALEGLSLLNDITYAVNDNLNVKAATGLSGSFNKSNAPSNFFGYNFDLGSEYKKSFYSLNANVYNSSPDYYLAGTQGGFLSDRLGAGIGGSLAFKKFDISGKINKYNSNLINRFEYGKIGMNEYSLNFATKFRKIPNVRFNMNQRKGSNDLAEVDNYFYCLDIFKKLNKSFSVSAGRQGNNYDTNYFPAEKKNMGFKSLYQTTYAKVDYSMPRYMGLVSLEHDLVDYKTDVFSNSYSAAKINYVFPQIKGFFISLGLGYRYKGYDKGSNFSVSIGRRSKSGRIVTVSYQFDRASGCFYDNMFIPTSSRHSINIGFDDALAFSDGLHSIGSDTRNKGLVNVIAYLDKNKNGKYDKDDIGVRNVPVKCSWQNKDILTNRRGKTINSIDKGIYNVQVDSDQLPATLSTVKGLNESKIIKVEPNKTTQVEIPMISCVGNVSGKLTLVDDFDRPLDIKEFIVVLLDENNNEVAYTTVDDDGKYYLSGISPGSYKIRLDQGFVDSYHLQAKADVKVDIPYVYDNFVDVNNVNLHYIQSYGSI